MSEGSCEKLSLQKYFKKKKKKSSLWRVPISVEGSVQREIFIRLILDVYYNCSVSDDIRRTSLTRVCTWFLEIFLSASVLTKRKNKISADVRRFTIAIGKEKVVLTRLYFCFLLDHMTEAHRHVYIKLAQSESNWETWNFHTPCPCISENPESLSLYEPALYRHSNGSKTNRRKRYG